MLGLFTILAPLMAQGFAMHRLGPIPLDVQRLSRHTRTSTQLYSTDKLFSNAKSAKSENLFDFIVVLPTFFVLNTVADLLRITGESSGGPRELALMSLLAECNATQPNGLGATASQRSNIRSLVSTLESFNPTPRPALRSDLQEGVWRLLYTDLAPPAASSGKLGPFIGSVMQKLEPSRSRIENILDIDSVGIRGVLTAKQSVLDDSTWQIVFDRLKITIFGMTIFDRAFPRKEIRNWRCVFLTESIRIIRAKRAESDDAGDEGFIFVLLKE